MKKCPKCAGFEFAIKYIETIALNMYGDKIEEHMEVECERCGYIKKELPLDYVDKKEKINE